MGLSLGLKGEELTDAMTSGGTKWGWDYITANQDRIKRVSELTKQWGLTIEEMKEEIEKDTTKKTGKLYAIKRDLKE